MLVEDYPVQNRSRLPRVLLIGATVVFALIGGGVLFLLFNWPFTRDAVAKGLGQIFSSTIQIQNFHSTYFPPGCVAETIEIKDGRYVGRVRKLTLQASWSTMLTGQRRIERIIADGLYLHILPKGENANGSRPASDGSGSAKLVVHEIIADGSLVEVARGGENKEPLRFAIHKLNLHNIGVNRSMTYRVALHNPEPSGEIQSEGEIGPWRSDEHGKLPVKGWYALEHADLGTFRYVGGELSSKGRFNGTLDHLDVQGPIQISRFEVKSSGHQVELTARFHAFVNGTNGDVALENVETHFARTTLVSNGEIAGKPGQHGKTISINVNAKEGRIQDLMRLMMKSNRAPLAGVVNFRSKMLVPPDGPKKLLERVQMSGDFGIGGANFTSPQTQKNVDILSERARGDKKDDADPEDVVSNVHGRLLLRGGVAHFSELSFTVPGASARLAGTFNIINQGVDLGGDLAMQAEVSEATKGIKSFLLKAVDPFFKRKKAGAVVPVHIGGTFSHPSYGVALTGKKH